MTSDTNRSDTKNGDMTHVPQRSDLSTWAILIAASILGSLVATAFTDQETTTSNPSDRQVKTSSF